MLDIKKLLTKMLTWMNTLQTVTTYVDSGKTITIASGATYNIYTYRTITLPANGKYIMLMNGGCGVVSGTVTYYSIQTTTASGTPSAANQIRQITPNSSGSHCSGVGYFETGNGAVTINIRGILYGSAGGKCTGGWHSTQVIRLK